MGFDLSVINVMVADAICGGNTAISGLLLTGLISLVLIIILYSYVPNADPRLLLIPLLLVSLVTCGLGWIDITMTAIIVIFSGLIIATSLSNIFNG